MTQLFPTSTNGNCFFFKFFVSPCAVGLTVFLINSALQWTVLSISFEVDVPTGKVGGRLLFERQGRKLPRGGLGAYPPRKLWNLHAWKWYFQLFPERIWVLRTIKMKTILTIFFIYYNRSFPQNLTHWLLEKSEMISLQMPIQKNTFNVLSSRCHLKKSMLSKVCLGFFGVDAISLGQSCENVPGVPWPFDLLQLFILPLKG